MAETCDHQWVKMFAEWPSGPSQCKKCAMIKAEPVFITEDTDLLEVAGAYVGGGNEEQPTV